MLRIKLLSIFPLPDGQAVKEPFETALPICRAARGSEILLLGPLPRYAVARCCEDPSHLTNFEEDGYVEGTKDRIKEVGKQLKNQLHMRE